MKLPIFIPLTDREIFKISGDLYAYNIQVAWIIKIVDVAIFVRNEPTENKVEAFVAGDLKPGG